MRHLMDDTRLTVTYGAFVAMPGRKIISTSIFFTNPEFPSLFSGSQPILTMLIH